MIEFLLTGLGLLLALAWAEAREWLPYLAKRIVRNAVKLVDTELRERMEEELVAEVASVPGKISPAVFAASVWIGFARVSFAPKVSIWSSKALLRALDVVFASALFTAQAPAFLFVSVGLRLSLGGPPLIARPVVGQNGRIVRLLAFRTVRKQGEAPPPFAIAVRRHGLHALPELWSVIRGDLSIVGPRPLRVRIEDGRAVAYAPDGFDSSCTLKPGLVWPSTSFTSSVEGFGVSLHRSFLVYFSVLGKAIWRTLRS